MALSEGIQAIEDAKKRFTAAQSRASADAAAVEAAKVAEESAKKMAEMAKRNAAAATSKAKAAAEAVELARKALEAAKAEENSAKEMAEMSEKNAVAAANNREGVEAQFEVSTEEVEEARKCLKDAETRWEIVPIDDHSDADESKSEKPQGKRICDLLNNWGTYDGELNANDLPHGKGKMTWDKEMNWYDGQWNNGMRHGEGTYKQLDGNEYEGQWKDNNCEGQGTFRYANDDVYEGQWKNGDCEGQGTCRYADGDVYEGQWKNGKYNGLGTYYWNKNNGEAEVCMYKDNEPVGEGVIWSKSRKNAWLADGGEKRRKISLKRATEMATKMGFGGAPAAMEQ